MKAVAYIRVSTDQQQLGPTAQRHAIQAWAERMGVTITSWHEDIGVSGGSDMDARPGLAQALASMRLDGAVALVVACRDRLARDLYIAMTIERAVAKYGGRIVTADGVGNGDTPADIFLRNILDAAASYERLLISARTKAALAAQRRSGVRSAGRVPFGSRVGVNGLLEPSEGELEAIATLRRLRGEGMGWGTISTHMAEMGYLNRNGRPFGRKELSRMASR